MPIMLTRKDGPPTPFRNAEYIPFYYFIPKSILSRCGAELNAIPRNPQVLLRNRAACEFVESDLFRLLIIDATAFMVWQYSCRAKLTFKCRAFATKFSRKRESHYQCSFKSCTLESANNPAERNSNERAKW